MSDTLKLIRGDITLGTIKVNPGNADFPWFSGVFKATPAYEDVRHLFERELALLRANSGNDSSKWEDWESVHAELHDPGLRLIAADSSSVVDELLIHINGDEAWWRGE